MPPRLSVVSGPHSGESISIRRGKLLIGREEDCQLRPDSEFVSRHHCVLLLDEYTLRVRDLGSKNGTFVNGHRIGGGERILLHGDMIAIGEMMCQVDLSAAIPEAATAEAGAHSAALLGTGIFDGDTVQADSASKISSPPPQTSPIPTPVIPGALPPADDSAGDTQSIQPPAP